MSQTPSSEPISQLYLGAHGVCVQKGSQWYLSGQRLSVSKLRHRLLGIKSQECHYSIILSYFYIDSWRQLITLTYLSVLPDLKTYRPVLLDSPQINNQFKMFSEFGLMKHSNCTWHELLSTLREAAKMFRMSLAVEKKQMVPSNGSRSWALSQIRREKNDIYLGNMF